MSAILIALLAPAFSFAVSFQGDPNTEYNEYDPNGVERIQVSNSAGRINISPMPAAKILITATKRKPNENCKVVIEKVQADLIVARVDRPLGEICDVDFELRVPQDISLDVKSGSGNATIAGVNGSLNFDLGSGNLVADGKFKKLEGKTGSGNVKVNGLTGPVALTVGSGDVNLSFNNEPKGAIDIKSGSGNATLLFPKGTRLKTALNTGSGDLVNDLPSSSSAEFGVSVKTGSGDLSIKSY